MVLMPVTYEPLRFVVDNMRRQDRDEVFATMHYFDPRDGPGQEEIFTQATLFSINQTGLGWIAAAPDGEPVACFGLSMLWPGVAVVGMFATDSFKKVARPLTRFLRKSMISLLNDGEIHRAHCWSMSSHSTAHAWLKHLGATEEATVPSYGRTGQDFKLFAWVRGRDY